MSNRRLKPARNIRRRVPSKQPKFKIIVFCEGSKSEPKYLESFNRINGQGLVEIITKRGAGVPVTLVNLAVEEKKRLERTHKKTKDPIDGLFQVWVVFDCDEHPNIPNAFTKARSNEVNVAYSNPCFEIWPYLHHVDHTAEIHRHKLQAELSKHIAGYSKEGSKEICAVKLDVHYDIAKQRAKKLKSGHEEVGSPKSSPYTDIFELLDVIKLGGR